MCCWTVVRPPSRVCSAKCVAPASSQRRACSACCSGPQRETRARLDADPGRVAPGVAGRLVDLLDAGHEVVRTRPAGHPAVGDAPDAVQHGRRVAADPDGDRVLRARADRGLRDRVELTLEAHQRLRPEPPHQRDLLLGAPPARAEHLAQAEPAVLDVGPADADPEQQPATGEDGHLGGLFRHERGLALRQHEDAGEEARAGGDGRQVAHQHHRLVPVRAAGVVAAPLGAARLRRIGGVAAEYVVVDLNQVVAEVLGGLGPVADRGRVRADLVRGEASTEFHRVLLAGSAERLRPGSKRRRTGAGGSEGFRGVPRTDRAPRITPSRGRRVCPQGRALLSTVGRASIREQRHGRAMAGRQHAADQAGRTLAGQRRSR